MLVAILAVLLQATAAVGQTLPRVAPETVGMSGPRLQRLTDALQQYVDEGRLPGAVALVARNGRVVYQEAVGRRDIELDEPLASDDLFRIASQTKAVVSVAIMMLQEEGALLVSDPVSAYLPTFAKTRVAEAGDGGQYEIVDARRAITLRDLLTHTAGVGYGGGPGGELWDEEEITGWYFAHREEPIAETVARMASLPFPSQPGEAFVYGYSTDILGAVVEVASGLPLDVFLQERIFTPLGMRDTHFYIPEGKRDRLATVYSLRGRLERAPDGPGMQAQGQYLDGPRTSFSGGAGLVSTADDYARFLQALLDGGALGDARILAPSSVALMTRNHIGERYSAPGMGFGLGFAIRLDVGEAGVPGSEGEFGWGGAYHSTYWVDPVEELVVVYFTQVIPASGLDDHARLRALVYGAVTDSYADDGGPAGNGR
jgi:CubicO group peptidase (beta-lactamase class C family)